MLKVWLVHDFLTDLCCIRKHFQTKANKKTQKRTDCLKHTVLYTWSMLKVWLVHDCSTDLWIYLRDSIG